MKILVYTCLIFSMLLCTTRIYATIGLVGTPEGTTRFHSPMGKYNPYVQLKFEVKDASTINSDDADEVLGNLQYETVASINNSRPFWFFNLDEALQTLNEVVTDTNANDTNANHFKVDLFFMTHGGPNPEVDDRFDASWAEGRTPSLKLRKNAGPTGTWAYFQEEGDPQFSRFSNHYIQASGILNTETDIGKVYSVMRLERFELTYQHPFIEIGGKPKELRVFIAGYPFQEGKTVAEDWYSPSNPRPSSGSHSSESRSFTEIHHPLVLYNTFFGNNFMNATDRISTPNMRERGMFQIYGLKSVDGLYINISYPYILNVKRIHHKYGINLFFLRAPVRLSYRFFYSIDDGETKIEAREHGLAYATASTKLSINKIGEYLVTFDKSYDETPNDYVSFIPGYDYTSDAETNYLYNSDGYTEPIHFQNDQKWYYQITYSYAMGTSQDHYGELTEITEEDTNEFTENNFQLLVSRAQGTVNHVRQ